jgi:endoglucanase
MANSSLNGDEQSMQRSRPGRAVRLGGLVGLLVASACADAVQGPMVNDEVAGGATAPTTPSGATATTNPLRGLRFHVAATSNARTQAAEWRASRPAHAAIMDRMAAEPQARWVGNWDADVGAAVSAEVGAAQAAGALAVLVAYNIPQRDCGGFSGANATTPDGYRGWVRDFARGLAGRRALVVLEPDAVPALDCLSAADRRTRLTLLREAVRVLADAGALVYLDAGHSSWHAAPTIAERLREAGIDAAAGFALNVSNFHATPALLAYGEALSALVGGRHFVLDTSRNGLGSAGVEAWCNPAGRALGARPTTDTGHPLADAFLWIKRPGESDGACDGAPAAGAWMPEYALGLAQRAGW